MDISKAVFKVKKANKSYSGSINQFSLEVNSDYHKGKIIALKDMIVLKCVNEFLFNYDKQSTSSNNDIKVIFINHYLFYVI